MKNWDYFCDHHKPLIYVYPNAILPKPSKVGRGTCWQGLNTTFLCRIHQSSATNACSRNPGLLRWGMSPFAEAKRNGASGNYICSKAQFCASGQNNWKWGGLKENTFSELRKAEEKSRDPEKRGWKPLQGISFLLGINWNYDGWFSVSPWLGHRLPSYGVKHYSGCFWEGAFVWV